MIVFQSRWFEELRLPEVDEIEKEKLGLPMAPILDCAQMRVAAFLQTNYGGTTRVTQSPEKPEQFTHPFPSTSVNLVAVLSLAKLAYRGPCIAPDGASP